MAPSTYCAAKDCAPSARAVSDAALTPELKTLWKANYCVYGVRKLWKSAGRAGIDIGRDQAGRLMRAAGTRPADSCALPGSRVLPARIAYARRDLIRWLRGTRIW